jgi:predicted nicotinamide N-methyase
MLPHFHRTPPEAITATERQVVAVERHAFQIDRPANPDELFRHPAVISAGASDEYIPYWAKLWPAARMLATAVIREPWETLGIHVLEVGCGLGLAGIACLARGLNVTFSDVDETALTFAAANARLNGFADFRTLPLDLRCPPDDAKYSVVIGSDLIYQDRLVVPLTRLLAAVLAPGGMCLLTDPDRPDCRRLLWHLEEVKLTVTADAVSVDDGGDGNRGTLYRIRHMA